MDIKHIIEGKGPQRYVQGQLRVHKGNEQCLPYSRQFGVENLLMPNPSDIDEVTVVKDEYCKRLRRQRNQWRGAYHH